MPLPLTVSCFSKIHIGFTFLVPAHLGSPGKRAIKRVCYLLYFSVAQDMSPKIAPAWGCKHPCNTWFLGPTRVHTPNSISIASAVLIGLTAVSNRHRPWNIDDNRPYLTLCTAMQPKKSKTLLSKYSPSTVRCWLHVWHRCGDWQYDTDITQCRRRTQRRFVVVVVETKLSVLIIASPERSQL